MADSVEFQELGRQHWRILCCSFTNPCRCIVAAQNRPSKPFLCMVRIPGRAPVPGGELQPSGQPSTLQIEDLENVCWRYPFPWGTVVALPEEGAKMTDDFAPFFPISIQALEAGFRLPLKEVGVQLCCQMGVAPGQLHPNTWRHIVAFVARCQELGLPQNQTSWAGARSLAFFSSYCTQVYLVACLD